MFTVLEDLNHTVFTGAGAADCCAALLQFAEQHGISGEIPLSYAADYLACSDNLFTQTVDRYGAAGPSLTEICAGECLAFADQVTGIKYPSQLSCYRPTKPRTPGAFEQSTQQIALALLRRDGREASLLLAEHVRRFGRGLMGRYRAFCWDGQLHAIEHPDPVTFDQLIGYDSQKQRIQLNVERFLQAKPCNNMLLYGDAGTGKSSCVKAALNAYAGQGLRLVDCSKYQLNSMRQLFDQLAARRQRFLVFLDDLSFEQSEIHFKELKSVLSGRSSAQPENVMLCATSNRRHLIRECFSDREDQELHASDTVTEKLSLSQRFGLTIYFGAPDQQQFLNIVAKLCSDKAVAYDAKIGEKALQWALVHHGLSGRSARQFVDQLDA